jgi:hypothetical protein
MTRLGLIALAVVTATSCGPKGGTDVGNGATVSFNVRAFEPSPPTGGQAITLASGVVVESVWAAIEDFRLSPASFCGGGGNGDANDVDFEGPAIADLLGLGVVNGVPSYRVAAGDYCRLRVTLHAVDPAELPATAPPELAGHSVLVTGRRADGVPFTIRTDQKFSLRLDAATPFDLAGEEPLIIGFDLASMIESVGLDSFPGPTIVIDSSTQSVLSQFDQALRKAPSLFRDADGDGDLSPAESAAGEALAVGTE